MYKIDKDVIVEGHVFILYHYEEWCLEAASIQTSLKLLVSNICKNIKTWISIKLFNYVIETIDTIFKGANYIYNFSTFTNKNFRRYFINVTHIDTNKIPKVYTFIVKKISVVWLHNIW